MNSLTRALNRFNSLIENSPLEGPVSGFNRHLKYMGPTTRDMVLQSRMPDIMSFAEDRSLDPGIIAGIAEASMRLGRIPDLGMYGLAGDDALAVKHFIADNVLNLAEQIEGDGSVQEDEANQSPKAKHLKLASDYKKLAEFHRRRAKEEADKAKISKDDGRAHSSIRANAASEEHKTLAAHCMGLADYHQLKANEHPADDTTKPPQYPAQDPHKEPAEPPQDKEKEPAPNSKGPKDEPEPKTEAFSLAQDPADASSGRMQGGVLGGAVGGYLGGPQGALKGAKIGQTAGGFVGGKRIKSAIGKATGVPFTEAVARFRRVTEDGEDTPANNAPPAPPKPGLLSKIGSGLQKAAVNTGATIGGTVTAAAAPITGLPTLAGNALVKGAKGQVLLPKPATEDTVSGSIAKAVVDPVGAKKTTAFPERMNSIIPMIERTPVETKYTRWGQDKAMYGDPESPETPPDRQSGQDYDTTRRRDEKERPTDKRKPMESVSMPRNGAMLEDILMEAKKSKAKKKAKKRSLDGKKVLANAKIAPMFHDLGHKMDHAETKATGKKFASKWSKELHSKCLKSGGSVASDAVISHSINNPWVREMGFTDEASNLRRNWETAMSDDAHAHAASTSPTAPEPVVFTVNKMRKMASK